MHFLEEKIHARKLIVPCKRARLINARRRMKMPLQMKGIARLKKRFHLNLVGFLG